MGVTFGAIGVHVIVKVVCDSRIHSWGQGFAASMQGEGGSENAKNPLSLDFCYGKVELLELASKTLN